MDLLARQVFFNSVHQSPGFTSSLGCAEHLNIDTLYNTVFQNHLYHHLSC